MTRRVVRMLLVCVLVLGCWPAAAAQSNADYLDAYIVQVKPEKRAEFEAISKKMAEANRNGGDQWITMETMYGDGDVVTFISNRASYADVEKGMGAYMGAMNKAYGEEGVKKIFADFSACVVSSRGELRLRRWDLSSNVPKDPAAISKMVGEARYLRTTMVRVKPGHVADFEAMVKDTKMAREKSAPSEVQLVSQAVAGQEGTVFYVTVLKPSMGGFDSVPTIQKLLGDDGYQKWLKTNADAVETTRSMIMRFRGDLSNAPAEVAAASPDFWTPKPAVAAAKKGGGKALKAAEKK
jgi:hypothetical protein